MTLLQSPIRAVLRSPLFSPLDGPWSAAFSPLSLSPSALYDMTNPATLYQDTAKTMPVTTVGQAARVVADISGNGYDGVAPSGVTSPVYNGAGLTFDGVNDYYQTTLNSSAWSAVTVSACFQGGTVAADQAVIGAFTSSNNNTLQLREKTSTGYGEFLAVSGSPFNTGSTDYRGQNVVLLGRAKSSGPVQELWANGALSVQNAIALALPNLTIPIGARRADSSFGLYLSGTLTRLFIAPSFAPDASILPLMRWVSAGQVSF